MTPEYIEFKQTIEKQRKVVARKQALADAQRVVLKAMLVNCQHEETKHESSYYSGSYYDKAYTERWVQCTLCGERSEKIHDQHSYYG
jgi:hypothetical protein